MNPENPIGQPPQVPPQSPPQTPQPVIPVNPQPWGMPSVIDAHPEVQTSEISHASIPKKSVNVVGILLVFIIMILVIGGTGVAASMIAYDKVTLGNNEIQNAIRQAVLSLPFTPKTPAYVIQNTATAMSKVTTSAVDASVALSSPMLLGLTGSNDLDITAKGTVDLLDKTNFKTQMNIQVGKLLAADIRSGDQKGYIKFTTVPTSLLKNYLPVPEETLNNILSNWIMWESNALNTDARKLIDQSVVSPEKSPQLIALLNNKTLMEKIHLTTEQLDGVTVYKLHPMVDQEFVTAYVDTFGTQLDKQNVQTNAWVDSLSDFNFDVYIDTNTYLIQKMTLSFASKNNSSLLSPVMAFVPQITAGNFQVAAVLKLSNYGRPFVFDAPVDAKNWQEVISEISATATASAIPTDTKTAAGKQEAIARDAKRKADLTEIGNVVSKYALEHNGELPDLELKDFPDSETCIGTAAQCFDLGKAGRLNGTIIPLYITKIPTDPQNGTVVDTKYTIQLDDKNRILLTANSEVDPSKKITVTK